MAFDNSTRNRLQRLVSDCRDLLTREFDAKLKEIYGIYADEGRVLALEKLATLDDEKLRVASLLRERISHLASCGGSTPVAIGEAVKRLLREQAFTVLNRFAALRMAEERGIIVESVGGGLTSKGFKTYSEVAHSGLGTAYERYRVFLGCIFDEMATDLGVLFDRRSPYGILFPRENVLLEMFGLLNAPEVKPLWKEDETVGWIYQYFNDPAERKKMRELSSAPRNSRELAVRNQFFTPRYVVEFLTDNTLGRIWYEMTSGSTSVKERCRYLVRRPNEVFLKSGEDAPAQTKPDNLSQEDLLKQPVFIPHRPIKDPRTILMLDPACGSMHFGLYAFDLYEIIYEEAWELEGVTGAPLFSRPAEMKSLRETYATKEEFLRQVPRLIIEHNLHGIDIDPRCAQIAGLSLWLRAQKSWQRLGVKPAERPRITRSNIVCAEPMPGEKELLREFVGNEFPPAEHGVFLQLLETIFDKMQLAGEAGSLLKIEEEINSAIEAARAAWQKRQTRPAELFSTGEINAVSKQAELDATADLRLLTSHFFEGVEERIYTALRDYAEQAENGAGFQRRLFAEDAARGFALIDVCRKRYDVALMNPPFGDGSKSSKTYIQQNYPSTKNDLYAAFVERFTSKIYQRGQLGAITSRTGFFLSSFQKWREEVLLAEAPPVVVADLGYGVLDSAMVETAAYCLERAPLKRTTFIRLLAEEVSSKALALAEAVKRLREGSHDDSKIFHVATTSFSEIPMSPFAYWVSDSVRSLYGNHPKLSNEKRIVSVGASTKDNTRFARAWWEVPSDLIVFTREATRRGGRWVPFAKGGGYAPFYQGVNLVLDWANDGNAIKTLVSEWRGQRGWGYQWTAALNGHSYYFRPGLTYGARVRRFSPQAFGGGIFSGSAYAIFVSDAMLYLALLNASMFRFFLSLQTAVRKVEVGHVQNFPLPSEIESSPLAKTLRMLAQKSFSAIRSLDAGCETSHIFCLPSLLQVHGISLKKRVQLWQDNAKETEKQVAGFQNEIDDLTFRLYGIGIEDRRAIEQFASFGEDETVADPGEQDETEEKDNAEELLGTSVSSLVSSVVSFAVGICVCRWDIRYATGEQAAPKLPDPFAPLPVCPPGQLQNAQGLPARVEDVPAAYPLKHIPWAGILVDDESHQCDLVARVRQVIEVIWGAQGKSTPHPDPLPGRGGEGGATAEAIEQEACEILGVKSLRDYFRKPAGFFADHLKRYSKSRRQAPIYWPLATTSGSYTLWIYYHRLTDQTLFQCVNDFVKPKIAEVEGDLSRFTTAGVDKPGARLEIERLTILRAELVEFRDELLRVAQLPYKPNLNDGVLITASPLWKLFRLPKWQKDLKACWTELERGDYDWAHLAYTLWPDRVKAVCKRDRSIAIAHGLEAQCDVKAPEKKTKKKKKDQMEMENSR